jgi:hypothetical protein
LNGRIKAALAVVIMLITIAGGTYGAISVFATNERVDVLERRVVANDIYWIKKQLWQLEDRYGHLDCFRMNDMDRERCRELKALLEKLQEK